MNDILKIRSILGNLGWSSFLLKPKGNNKGGGGSSLENAMMNDAGSLVKSTRLTPTFSRHG
jgi:hypothetical protein